MGISLNLVLTFISLVLPMELRGQTPFLSNFNLTRKYMLIIYKNDELGACNGFRLGCRQLSQEGEKMGSGLTNGHFAQSRPDLHLSCVANGT